MKRSKSRTQSSTRGDLVRLNKFLADNGVCSRRKADALIEEGKVRVNGRTVADLGTKIRPHQDKVTAKGKAVSQQLEKVYLMFNKPKSVLTSTSDPEGRPVVMDFFKKFKRHRLYPVGRLDWDTEGLLLITNDGDFAHKVIHPDAKVPKTYLAKLDGLITQEKMSRLKKGVTIIGGRVSALHIEKLHRTASKHDWVKIVVDEGKNRQVRRMFEKVGYDVKKLQRVAIGRLRLGSLKRGEHRLLTTRQIQKIFETGERG